MVLLIAVDPLREQEMLDPFHTHFRAAAESFRGRGFVDLKMFKLRTIIQGGPVPAAGINYPFQLPLESERSPRSPATDESEDKSPGWVSSESHGKVLPLVENTVLNKDYVVLLTDAV